MTTTHTSGPWFVASDGSLNYYPEHGGWSPVPNTPENRRLQASSPDLLDALYQCLRDIESQEYTHGRNFAAGNVARDAIEKATGIRPDEVCDRQPVQQS